jgi:8-oxo-dGTP diphosphatase
VQFWRMQAEANPSRDVMEDIMAVEWLPLSAAIRKLSYPLERLFLSHVGRNILRSRRKTRSPGRKSKSRHGASKARRHPASRVRKSARISTGRSRTTILRRVLGLSS